MMAEEPLPEGWRWESLERLAAEGAPILYGILQPGPNLVDGVPYVRPTEIVGDRIDLSSVRRTAPEIAAKYSRSLLRTGDLILSIVGTIGKVAIVPADLDGGNITQSSVRVRVKPDVAINRYIAWALRSPVLTQQYDRYRLGTAVPRLNVAHVRSLRVPLPSLKDQSRIVEEIEKQFTRLDAGVGALGRLLSNLKRYRTAVFKAAYEGLLVPTEAELARRERRPYETGAELMRRTFRVSGGDRHDATTSQKFAGDLPASGLLALPEGWEWTTLDAISEIKGGITKDQKRRPAGPARLVPYLRVANVQRGYLDLDEVKRILATETEIHELALKPGDVLFNEGGDRDKLGRGWVWNDELPECIHQNHVFRARLLNQDLHPKFLSWYANSSGQTFFFEQGKHTTNLASISMTKLRRLPVPVPPAAEQLRIVLEIDRLLSLAAGIEAIVVTSLRRARRLRQAILYHAFGGKPHGFDSDAAEADGREDATPLLPPVANIPETESQMSTMSDPVESLTQLVEVLEALGGSASPEALLTSAGLATDIELFFDLLREGNRTGRLTVPVGHTAPITRGPHAG